MRRPAMLLGLAALLFLAIASPAEAAERKVPFGFFGTVLHPMPDAELETQMTLMAQSGVESGRVILLWEYLEPARGVYDWSALDGLAAAAARHGLALLPNVTQTPRWASERPDDPEFWRWPGDSNAYGELMRQLVLRYGPNGSFWAQNPSLPRVPIRQWQIWNEQTAPWHWKPRPWGPSYTRLLRSAYGAIHGADPGAKVVAGSLVAFGNDYAPWDGIRELYRAGAKRFFDVIAIHPFTNSRSAGRAAQQTLEVVRRVRAHMVRRGDRRKAIILTEMTWPAAVGRVPSSALRQAAGLATTPRGQVQRLEAAYRQLARARRKMRITQVYWYAWATEYDRNSPESVMAFRFSGLNRFSGGVFSRMPILKSYANLAAKYQGCRKGADARRCRR